MNFFDQIKWQTGQAWRQVSEQSLYWLQKWFLSRPNQQPTNNPDWLEPLIVWLARGIAALLALAVVYLVVRFLWPWWQRRRSPLRPPEAAKYTAIARSRSASEWLLQSRQLQAQGDYAAACRCLYLALLLRLEEGGWLPQDPARTNREYLRGLESFWLMGQRPLNLREAAQQIFATHDQIFYGGQAVSSETWQRCDRAYSDLESELLKPSTT
jgi:Domain of unknown function (DUF4129)